MSSSDGLDDILNEIGMGRWQVLGLVANFLIWSVLSPHTIGTTLLNAPVPFQCLSQSYNGSSAIRFSKSEKDEQTTKSKIFESKCIEVDLQVSENYKDSEYTPIVNVNTSVVWDPLSNSVLPSCPHVHYDDSIFSSTITTEWHLVCEQSSLRTLFQNIYTIGLIIGGFIGGDVGDRLGRAKAVLVGSFIHAIATVIVAFTANFTLILIGRFVVGLTNLMILVPVVTLSMETCPERFRGPIGMMVGMPYSIGVVVFAGLGVFLRDWRHLYIATSFPALLLLPVSWLLDESPRWLLQVGRFEEAKEIVEKAAKINRHKFESMEKVECVLRELLKEEDKTKTETKDTSGTLSEKLITQIRGGIGALRTPAMRKISIISPTVWFLNEAVYYGIIFNANSFSSDNPFLYVALTGVCDGLAIILGTIGTYFGRKFTIAGSQFIAGSLLLLVLVTPDDIKWLQWIFIMTGFLMCACASQALFVYTPELFPTTIRARGFAFSNLTGYTGTLVAPFIPDFLATFGWWITNAILGSFSIIAGTMIMSLVETRHIPLCETIQDVEDREKGIYCQQPKLQNDEKHIDGTPTIKRQNKENINFELTMMSKGIDNYAMEKEI